MGYIRNNNVWKINKILAGISSGGVSPEDVQDMIDTSLTNYPNNTDLETALSDKQDTLTAGFGISINENNEIINTVPGYIWKLYTKQDWSGFIENDDSGNCKVVKETVLIHIAYQGKHTVYIIPKGEGSFENSNTISFTDTIAPISTDLFTNKSTVSCTMQKLVNVTNGGIATINDGYQSIGNINKLLHYPSYNELYGNNISLYVLRGD